MPYLMSSKAHLVAYENLKKHNNGNQLYFRNPVGFLAKFNWEEQALLIITFVTGCT